MTQHAKSDKYFKWFLVFAVAYFLIHIGMGLANAQSTTQPIIQCWNNGYGTIQCTTL